MSELQVNIIRDTTFWVSGFPAVILYGCCYSSFLRFNISILTLYVCNIWFLLKCFFSVSQRIWWSKLHSALRKFLSQLICVYFRYLKIRHKTWYTLFLEFLENSWKFLENSSKNTFHRYILGTLRNEDESIDDDYFSFSFSVLDHR